MTTRRQAFYENPILQGGVIVLMVIVAYFRALSGEFLWDDDSNVTDNPTLRSLKGLGQIWFKPGATQQFYPLTHSSFWLDYHLWGLHPLGFHAGNILLHALSAVLIWRILLRLSVPGAWLGAALFALHPTCVESVAWITERKNMLSGPFFLGSIFASIQFWLPKSVPSNSAGDLSTEAASSSQLGPRKFYWLTLVLYACALCAKTAAVALPAVIVLLLWWKRGKVEWRNILSLFPFLVVGMGMGLMTMWMEKNHVGANGEEWQIPWVERFLIAGRAVWFYLGKLIWPYPVEFMYPRWVINSSQPLDYLPLLALVGVLIYLWTKRNGWGRPVLFTMGYFIALLMPVLGFFKVFFYRYSFVCDHFQYLASIAPLALAGAGLTMAFSYFQKQAPLLKPVACAAILIILGALTWHQTPVYHSVKSLWDDTIARNPRSWMAYNNLGNYYVNKGQTDDAIVNFSKCIEIYPADAQAQYNLGLAMATKGRFDEAAQLFNEAMRLDPDYLKAEYQMGYVLFLKGHLDEAKEYFQKSLALQPDFQPALFTLGSLLMRQGKTAEAMNCLNSVIQLNADMIEPVFNLGNDLAAQKKYQGAVACYQAVLRAKPNHWQARGNLAIVLSIAGRNDDAVTQYKIVLGMEPNDVGTHNNLGATFLQMGRVDEAIQEFQTALRLDPNDPKAVLNLARAQKQKNPAAAP